MRKAISAAVCFLFLLGLSFPSIAESTWEFAVQVSASVQENPARITLTWPQDTLTQPTAYTVFRKNPNDTSWGPGVTLPGNTVSYTDDRVATGVAYEYQIVKNTPNYAGYGYICTGVNVPLTDERGRLLLVVDDTQLQPLAAELRRLRNDLVGDGWTVSLIPVGRNDSAAKVKGFIKSQYLAAPAEVKAVFLFGHVPVPYSGDIVPDGHVPDHRGAWPADAYYGDMDGAWTDTSVNNTAATDARNRNVPGDGKFDQSTLPAPLKLMVGRVDLANMPGRLTWGGPASFASETELLRNYLNKDHRYRHKQFDLPRKAVLGDFFGSRDGEAFAASGWRSFAPLFGATNIENIVVQGRWVPTVAASPSLFVYGCGAGSYGSIAGLGNSNAYKDVTTTELVGNDVKAAFALLFGSWLGDWDSEDNILRSVLALPSYGLASAWSGRPHWFLHHLGLGQPIGFSARLTQNNGANGLYRTQVNSCAGLIHVALMGDPTLRLHTVAPVGALTGSVNAGHTALAWQPSPDASAGYHVYRAPNINGPFQRLTEAPLASTSYSDPAVGMVYMVRAVRKEVSPSGSYLNASQGVFFGAGLDGELEIVTGTTPPANGGSSPAPNGPGSTTETNIFVTPTGDLPANRTLWFDDRLPAGAVAGAGSDSWNWQGSPLPFSGAAANLSSSRGGLHQQFFTSASSALTLNPGDVLFACVYLDPVSVPNQVMLQWYDGSWEHRAYWGSDLIDLGVNNTASRRYLGGLPAAGKWALLQVRAADLGLEGKTVSGMAFTLYNGLAALDFVGKSAATPSTQPPASTNPPITSMEVVWVEDSLPAGAVPGGTGGESWTWVRTNPPAFGGSMSHLSANLLGLHQHYFTSAASPLRVDAGDSLFTYVYIDPDNVPSEVMLQWFGDSWEHRAYWGADNIGYGSAGTASRRYMGPVPAAGRWVRLEVPARLVGLEGQSIAGMAFSLFNGSAAWDRSGKLVSATQPSSGGTNVIPSTNITRVVWFDDQLPAGAVPGTENDSWDWATAGPAPYSGSRQHRSSTAAGLHQHYFTYASQTLSVGTGDYLFTYVYLDPANPPSQVMLQWNDGTWEHRAYWGANLINYGLNATINRQYMGPLPPAGRWAVLQVPAGAVGLENRVLSGMAFTLYGGRASWDMAGKANAPIPDPPSRPDTTNNLPVVTNSPPPVVVTNGSPSSSPTTPRLSGLDALSPELPSVGANTLNVLTPGLLELVLVTSKDSATAPSSAWDFVDANSRFTAPPAGAFQVTVDGQPVTVTSVGFKRRPLYAPLAGWDLRVGNYLYLRVGTPIAENQTVEVKNSDASLWPASMTFSAKADPLRLSPAIHVNQEGYLPGYAKTGRIGYYAGSLGEMDVPVSEGFKLVDTQSGQTVFEGSLALRKDVGYSTSPTPYQKVYEADFSAFTTPGEYRVVVPGLGGSTPFLVNEGIAMSFARAYALGLYHQRCGTNLALPYSRFTHDACHLASAAVPASNTTHAFTWNTIASFAGTVNNNNPPQIAPALTQPSAQLFPYVNQNRVDVSGGHHDAGDYSKYTINSASLVHNLIFAVDSLSGVAALDNLGLPESGDGISDLLQEAKWEADFIAKMQDADGGFYFLVYPEQRKYESDVAPDHGDPQVVWPKTTSVTAAAVAALAQCASSPAFKRAYPDAASRYLQKARLGWQFLLDAISRYGKNGAYQKITHYGDDFADNDELAWAACEMFLATADADAHAKLRAWFDPADPATWRWGWWRMCQGYGNAIRSYAFAARSGRLATGALNAAYLLKCEQQVLAAAEDVLKFSQQNAYGTSFPVQTKAMQTAGWYFSCDQAFDLAVAYELSPKPQYLAAILENLNFEAGCNPVNVSYLTGMGWKRPRDIVSQWALNDSRRLPPSGIPVGNIQGSFGYLWNYQGLLEALCYPSDSAATAPYPFYDRWGDSWNVSAEMVVLNQARGLGALAFLAAKTSLKSQSWQAVQGQIQLPSSVVPVGTNVTLSMSAPGIDLSGARITWEARDQEPAYGDSFTFAPVNNGPQWIEAEALLPDGRRIFATGTFTANSPDITWCDDALPAGATAGADGGDSWTWVASPTPQSGQRVHESAAAEGAHQHFFSGSSVALDLGTGDVLYAYVYLDPANPPTAIMLQWNSGNSWNHRAYWGANVLPYGADGTTSRRSMGPLPATGTWVQLKVPAAAVGLEGRTVTGMAFTLFGGRAWWDAAGRVSAAFSPAATVAVSATAAASRMPVSPGVFTFTRDGATNDPLTLDYSLEGSAVGGVDYVTDSSVVIPSGARSATLQIVPLPAPEIALNKAVTLKLRPSDRYATGPSSDATVPLLGNTVKASVRISPKGPTLSWASIPNQVYRVASKSHPAQTNWVILATVKAEGEVTSWTDTDGAPQRFYVIAVQ